MKNKIISLVKNLNSQKNRTKANKGFDLAFYGVAIIFGLTVFIELFLWLLSKYSFSVVLYTFLSFLSIYIIKFFFINYNIKILSYKTKTLSIYNSFKWIVDFLFIITISLPAFLYLYILAFGNTSFLNGIITCCILLAFIFSLFLKFDLKIKKEGLNNGFFMNFILFSSIYIIGVSYFLKSNGIKGDLNHDISLVAFVLFILGFLIVFSDFFKIIWTKILLLLKYMLDKKRHFVLHSILRSTLFVAVLTIGFIIYQNRSNLGEIINKGKIETLQKEIQTVHKLQNNFDLEKSNLLGEKLGTDDLITDKEKETIKGLFEDEFGEGNVDESLFEIKPEPVIEKILVKKKIGDLYKFDRFLGLGTVGEDVKKLQEYLKIAGYNDFEITGIYNNDTINSLRNFLITEFGWPQSTRGIFGPSANRDFSSFEIEVEVGFFEESNFNIK